MSCIPRLCFFALVTMVPFLVTAPACCELLTRDAYLDQVRVNNKTYVGWQLERSAALDRGRRSDLVTSPSAFANGRFVRDEKLPSFPVFVYDRLDTRNYAAGFEGVNRFGTRARLAYEMDYTNYVGVNDPAFAGVPLRFWDSRPVLELTQSLWKNAAGRSTRAEIDALSAEARAAVYRAEAQLRQLMADAEVAYWALALTRATVTVQEEALKSADAINTYTQKQNRMNLGDEADALQSFALYESRRLELKRARDAEREALREFNALRNRPLMEPVDVEQSYAAVLAQDAKLPSEWRADVLAAQAETELVEATARRQAESDKPTLEAFGSYALNGRDPNASDAFSDSYDADRPTASAGLRFSVPLDIPALAASRRGALNQAQATRTRLEQLQADEKSDRVNLEASIEDTRERLRLSTLIVDAQKKKLTHERDRLRKGRTSTYQVLLFEQDYSQAELARVLAARSLLELLSQARLYYPADEENL